MQSDYHAKALRRLAEIGVHIGDFSAVILDAVEPARLHLIDPWHYEGDEQYKESFYGGAGGKSQTAMDRRHKRVCDRFAAQIERGQVEVHRAFSTDALAAMPDDSLDWVYIDGNHLRLALRKTRPGGYITGDDYGPGGWWKGGVKRAVDEFARSQPVDLIMIRNAQYALRCRNER